MNDAAVSWFCTRVQVGGSILSGLACARRRSIHVHQHCLPNCICGHRRPFPFDQLASLCSVVFQHSLLLQQLLSVLHGSTG